MLTLLTRNSSLELSLEELAHQIIVLGQLLLHLVK